MYFNLFYADSPFVRGFCVEIIKQYFYSGGNDMPDTNRFNKKCKFLIPDGNFYLCAATESDRIKNCISFCPTECKKFQSKKGKTAEDSSVIEGGSNGSL